MGVGEKLQSVPKVWVVIAIVVVVVAVLAEAYSLFKAPSVAAFDPDKMGAPVFYTSDGGATFFRGYDKQENPVDSRDIPAVKAYVFSCGGKQIVLYMEKYSSGPGSSLMVKSRGAGEWVADSTPAAEAIRHPKCPDGGTPVPVQPSN